MDPKQLQIDSYHATAHTMTVEDSGLLHELAIGVHWPHRNRDLRQFLQLGHGVLALDDIGRAIASGMAFPVEDNFATLGMMITAPRLQTYGTGSWMFDTLIASVSGRALRLNATRAGYKIYEGAGFVPVGTIYQHQGHVRAIRPPSPAEGVTLRPMSEADQSVLRALDRTAFAAGRPRTLDLLFATCTAGVVAERAGQVCGYALRRPFGRGEQIGPVVADSDRMAMQLAAALLAGQEGKFLRFDVPEGSGDFSPFLAAVGLGVYDTVTEMYLVEQRRPLSGTRLFGLSCHALG